MGGSRKRAGFKHPLGSLRTRVVGLDERNEFALAVAGVAVVGGLLKIALHPECPLFELDGPLSGCSRHWRQRLRRDWQ